MYTIEETAQRCGLTPHTLRYYEREGLLPPIGRNRGGQRRYSDGDLGWINFVMLLKATGMGLSRIRDFVAAEQQGPGGASTKIEILVEHQDHIRAQMEQMSQFLNKLEQKIQYYGGRT